MFLFIFVVKCIIFILPERPNNLKEQHNPIAPKTNKSSFKIVPIKNGHLIVFRIIFRMSALIVSCFLGLSGYYPILQNVLDRKNPNNNKEGDGNPTDPSALMKAYQ